MGEYSYSTSFSPISKQYFNSRVSRLYTSTFLCTLDTYNLSLYTMLHTDNMLSCLWCNILVLTVGLEMTQATGGLCLTFLNSLVISPTSEQERVQPFLAKYFPKLYSLAARYGWTLS